MSHDLSMIETFLSERRLALVGASHDERAFSRGLMREMVAAGYEIVPVNRRGGTIDGRLVHPSLAGIPESVGGVIVMVQASEAEAVVREAAAAGIRRVWLHRGAGPGAVSPAAEAAAAELGLELVSGECPLMFVGKAAVHRMHGTMRRLEGRYPRRRASEPASSTLVERLLAILNIFIGFAAALTGAIIIADPSGEGLGWTPALLRHTPFASFLIPGIVLFAVNGLGQLGSFVLVARRHPRAALAAIGLGAFLMGWILMQWLWLDGTSWLQFLFFGLGAAEVVLGVLFHRSRWPRPTFVIRTDLPRGVA